MGGRNAPATPSVAALMAMAMAVAVFPSLALGVLARSIMPDLGIARAELGIAVATISGVAALTAVSAGRLVDRFGGRRGLLIVFAFGAAGIGGLAVAPTFPVMLGCALLAGVCSGTSNPATNKVVVETLELGRRGLVTGVKQSGEMIAVVVCGVLLPFGAVTIGWRPAFALASLTPLLAAVAVVRMLPPEPPRPRDVRGTSPRPAPAPIVPGVIWLAVYAGFMGVGGGAISTYLPLYAQEALGYEIGLAGWVVAVTGLVAIGGRIAWAHVAERWGDMNRVLAMNAGLALASVALMWSSSLFDTGFVLWIGAVGWGASLLSFGAVAMLAVMAMSAPTAAGRSSGIVLTGFSFGLMVGPPLYGFLADATARYDAGMAVVAGVMAAAFLTAIAWRIDERRRWLAATR